MQRLIEKEKFITRFQLPRNGFSKPTPFQGEFGFSVSKDRKQNGRNFSSLYKFYINESSLNTSKELKPIITSVAYGERIKDGSITLTPKNIKSKLSWPINLSSDNEFFYNISSNIFFHKNKEINAFEILLKIENWHTRPTKFFRGARIRTKLFFYRTFLTKSLKSIYNFLITFLYIISGTKTERSIWLVSSKTDAFYEKKEINKESFAYEKINIFGYKASAWSVVAYFFIHLMLYFVWYFDLFNIKNLNLPKTLFQNGFLTLAYIIPSLVIFERLIPELIKVIIIHVSGFFHRTSFKKIKI